MFCSYYKSTEIKCFINLNSTFFIVLILASVFCNVLHYLVNLSKTESILTRDRSGIKNCVIEKKAKNCVIEKFNFGLQSKSQSIHSETVQLI